MFIWTIGDVIGVIMLGGLVVVGLSVVAFYWLLVGIEKVRRALVNPKS